MHLSNGGHCYMIFDRVCRANVLWVTGVFSLSEYLFSKTGIFVFILYCGVYIKIVNKIEFIFKLLHRNSGQVFVIS